MKPESRQEEIDLDDEFAAGELEEAENIDVILKKIVDGNINVKIPSQVRLVLIFTSSTFTGMPLQGHQEGGGRRGNFPQGLRV